MKKTNLKTFISNNAHWTINKTLSRKIGLIETLILQHLVDLQSVFERNEIFQPIPEMAVELGITEYSIKQALPKLQNLNLITIERKSVGYKNFYKVNEENVKSLIFNDEFTSELNSTHWRVEGKSELDSTSQSVENSLTSELNSTLSELDSTSQSVENIPAITNNTTNNTLQKIKIKNTTAGSSGNLKNITQKILDILIDTESDIPSYNRAIEDYNELGGIDGVSNIMDWDFAQKQNWNYKIQNVYSVK